MAKYHEGSSLGVWIIVGITIFVFAGIGVFAYITHEKPTSEKTTREVALTCTTDMATQFHIHPLLAITINGQKQEIPADIGITQDCMYSLHTHDNSGTIHVEAEEKRDFTLDDFFVIWGKTFNKNQILDEKVDDKHEVVETVNGQVVQDYEHTILRDKDQIVISYQEKK